MANLNLNKVILGGRLTSDVELKQTPQGISVCSFSIAVNRKGKDAGVDFINCQAWRNTAELISKYFYKGSSICLSGSIQVREWKDNNGQKRYSTEVIANEVYFVDSKADDTKVAAPNFEEVSNDEDLPF